MTPATRYSVLSVGVLLLTACGGGSSDHGSSAPTPAPASTLSDLTPYLAQQRCPDGTPPLGCAGAAPQRASDPMSWRRFDGQDQVGETVVSDDASYFITTWSYAPFGTFAAANGDGGEVYVQDGTLARITATQDGGKPGIQRFAVWGLFNSAVVDCANGWSSVDAHGRACRATLTFPASGYGLTQIVADTIIAEHYSGQNYTGDLERIYLASGWGRLCWEAYNANPPRGGMPPGCASGGPDVGRPASDRRRSTNLIPVATVMPRSVDAYGWPPSGFAP